MDDTSETNRAAHNPAWEAGHAPAGGPEASPRRRPGVMDEYQSLGHPRYDEDTMPNDERNARSPGYVSYARPIGPGHAESGPILKGNVVTLIGVVLLSWLPIIGPFAAGVAGGWVARGWRGGLLATFFPGFVASGILWFYYSVLQALPGDFLVRQMIAIPSLWPILMTGMGLFVWAGGILGGYVHSRREHGTAASRVQVG